MSIVNTFKCDSCGKMRVHDANNWFSIQLTEANYIIVAHFDEETGTYKHYCGEECAQAAIQRWMATGKLEPASATPIQHAVDTREYPEGV